jgi:hypothetical protein
MTKEKIMTTKSNKTYAQRMINLAKVLLALRPEEFDFSQWVTEWEGGTKKEPLCGTVCCAAGYLPVADPKNWKWVREVDTLGIKSVLPCPVGKPVKHPNVYLTEYFNIDRGLVYGVFHNQGYRRFHVTAEEVAEKLVVLAKAHADLHNSKRKGSKRKTFYIEPGHRDYVLIYNGRDPKPSNLKARVSKRLNMVVKSLQDKGTLRKPAK